MKIQLLGSFSVSSDQCVIQEMEWHSRRACHLVKLLGLAPGHRLHRDQVIEALWPDATLSAASNNFHHALFTARKVLDRLLPGCLILESGILSLSDQVTVDVEAFEAATRKALASRDLTDCQTALTLYTGDLLPDDRYESWTPQPREALRQTYLNLLLTLAQEEENLQAYPEGIAALQRLLAVDPAYEEAHRALIRLYGLSGQRPQALRQFQALRQTLQTELGVEPGQETLQLYEAIQTGQFPAAAEKQIPGEPHKTERTPPVDKRPLHNLPYRLSSFIGREKEIGEVIGLLSDARLLTITGAGGIGKTSLALQAAGQLLEAYPDGVWLVELAPISDPELVPQACAQVLELIKQSEASYQVILTRYLQKKTLLLVLDNCEHLIEACMQLAVELLKHCPGLTLLATSRERFNLDGEITYRVPSMALPVEDPSLEETAESEAVRLFVERAGRVSPGFRLTRDNATCIAQICQRLDGIPLAIELAAARVRAIAVEEITARLGQAFQLLTGGSLADLPRHRTLQAAIDWSYDLLSP